MNRMNILIACEESQTVCRAFRKKGFDAFSCDLLPSSGGHPEWHIQKPVEKILGGCIGLNNQFWTEAETVERNIERWDCIIAHPPCTYLTVTGNKWMKPEFRDRFPDRPHQRAEAISFFLKLAEANCDYIAIENPVGIMSTKWRKPDQYVHPYHFGDPHSKKTGLWLKGLPKLEHTEVVEPIMYTYKDGRKDPIWHVESLKLPTAERSRVRSKTFEGMAEAMANQWGKFLEEANVAACL